MQAMFESCNSLTSLDLSQFKTDKVNNMYAMFHECYSLEELKINFI